MLRVVETLSEAFGNNYIVCPLRCIFFNHVHVCDVIASDGSVVDHADDGDTYVDSHSVHADDSEGKHKSEQKSLRAEQSLRLYEYI